MDIRPKLQSDNEPCLELLRAVHDVDLYPRYWPRDPSQFLAPEYETAAWIATDDGAIVGHVALHDASRDPTLPAAQRATGAHSAQLAVLARLLVAPDARRQGIGGQLVDAATKHARSLGQRCVLDVVQSSSGAIALYESLGWQRVEQLSLALREHPSLDLWVYVGPA